LTRVKVIFPSMLMGITCSEREVEIHASTLGEALGKLAEKYGDGFRTRILDSTGRPKRLVNLYVNGKNVRFLKLLETPLEDGDEISILPSVSGG